MIKRSTWVMLFILFLAVFGYLLVNKRISTAVILGTPTSTVNTYLITQAAGTLETLRIIDKNNHETQIQRGSSGLWEISQPRLGTVDQSLATAAETQVGALKVVTTLSSSPNLKDIGLDNASYTITLIFSGGKQSLLEIGASTASGSGYYVQVDKGQIYVISKDGIDALANLISNPPYVATDTLVPSPITTDTITPSSTIVPSATPTP